MRSYTDAGLAIGTPTRPAQVDDLYVWGSITKMFTCPAVLQLVDAGKLSLDDPLAPHVDPFLRRAGSSVTLESRFGAEVNNVTVRASRVRACVTRACVTRACVTRACVTCARVTRACVTRAWVCWGRA